MTPEQRHEHPSLFDDQLHDDNMRRLDRRDILVASTGGAGQSLLGNILQEAGLNYADPYTEVLHPNGSSTTAPGHENWRQRLAATAAADSEHTPIRTRRRPRFVKTEQVPTDDGAPFSTGSSVWVLARDPRDALYSRYRFRRDFARDPAALRAGSFGQWLAQPDLCGLFPPAYWAAFYHRWLDSVDGHLHLVTTRFEDLKNSPVEALSRALPALGVTPDRDLLLHAAERSSFNEHARARGRRGRQRRAVQPSSDHASRNRKRMGRMDDADAPSPFY